METGSVVIEVMLQAEVDKVWGALTEKEQMSRWYFTIAEFSPSPGFQFKMFGEKKGVIFPISCTVKEVDENKKLSYTWSYDDYPAETLVIFELKNLGDQTELRLRHEGLQNIPHDGTETSVRNHADGWDFIIRSSLKQYIEVEAALDSNSLHR